jgi:hypothetical protein
MATQKAVKAPKEFFEMEFPIYTDLGMEIQNILAPVRARFPTPAYKEKLTRSPVDG